jgi:hypothetical protein
MSANTALLRLVGVKNASNGWAKSLMDGQSMSERWNTCTDCGVTHSPALCPDRIPEVKRGINCVHLDFAVHADVNRIEDKGAFMVDIRVECLTCGLPFEFVGVDAGLSFAQPMASVDGQILRAPLRPKGCILLPAIPGSKVKAN